MTATDDADHTSGGAFQRLRSRLGAFGLNGSEPVSAPDFGHADFPHEASGVDRFPPVDQEVAEMFLERRFAELIERIHAQDSHVRGLTALIVRLEAQLRRAKEDIDSLRQVGVTAGGGHGVSDASAGESSAAPGAEAQQNGVTAHVAADVGDHAPLENDTLVRRNGAVFDDGHTDDLADGDDCSSVCDEVACGGAHPSSEVVKCGDVGMSADAGVTNDEVGCGDAVESGRADASHDAGRSSEVIPQECVGPADEAAKHGGVAQHGVVVARERPPGSGDGATVMAVVHDDVPERGNKGADHEANAVPPPDFSSALTRLLRRVPVVGSMLRRRTPLPSERLQAQSSGPVPLSSPQAATSPERSVEKTPSSDASGLEARAPVFLHSERESGPDAEPQQPVMHEAAVESAPETPPPASPALTPRGEFDDDVALISRSSLFDAEWYRAQCDARPDRAELTPDANLVEHYCRVGCQLGIDPHPLFDSVYYLAGLLSRSPAGNIAEENGYGAQSNPLAHYLRAAPYAAPDPHPLFEGALYCEGGLPGPLHGSTLLEDFLDRNGDVRPNPGFLPGWYRVEYLAAAALEINPLIHYVTVGERLGLAPHPLFDPRNYLAEHPEFTEIGALTGYLLSTRVTRGAGEDDPALPPAPVQGLGATVALYSAVIVDNSSPYALWRCIYALTAQANVDVIVVGVKNAIVTTLLASLPVRVAPTVRLGLLWAMGDLAVVTESNLWLGSGALDAMATSFVQDERVVLVAPGIVEAAGAPISEEASSGAGVSGQYEGTSKAALLDGGCFVVRRSVATTGGGVDACLDAALDHVGDLAGRSLTEWRDALSSHMRESGGHVVQRRDVEAIRYVRRSLLSDVPQPIDESGPDAGATASMARGVVTEPAFVAVVIDRAGSTLGRRLAGEAGRGYVFYIDDTAHGRMPRADDGERLDDWLERRGRDVAAILVGPEAAAVDVLATLRGASGAPLVLFWNDVKPDAAVSALAGIDLVLASEAIDVVELQMQAADAGVTVILAGADFAEGDAFRFIAEALR
ncbi:hypothetical protein J2D73_04565 [Acetobacter sacchari]|uniref:Uncharacterized protein n=1 Tax=Acetobacter sacchari TaxID=2661687 RepID=A0ABS3LT38_9PROT|nr:hypothetical protein [Acetobacter sacchari]MBO1359071.1 hypothetical protein [Acetobacter sacchari]